MTERVFEILYANHPVYYSFLFAQTRYQFRSYIKRVNDIDHYDIKVSSEMIEQGRSFLPAGSSDSYIEYRLLIQLTSRYLLRYHCCIFHCVSFVYKGYAWLLSAPSGTGKTTQYFNWQGLFSDEITMISGDMPVLECRNDGKICVYPTSWNGKENIGNKISAPLGGVIYLEQGKENNISGLSAKEGILEIFKQFIVIPETKEDIESLAYIIDGMFRNYPVMKYINKGNDDSTCLLRETINEILEERYEIHSQTWNSINKDMR